MLEEKSRGRSKVLKLSTPPRLQPLKKQGLAIDIDLEALYSDEIWEKSDCELWLEEIENISSRLTQKKIDSLLSSGKNPVADLNPEDAIRIKKRFTSGGKKDVCKYLLQIKDAEAETALQNFKKLISDLEKHLFKN